MNLVTEPVILICGLSVNINATKFSVSLWGRLVGKACAVQAWGPDLRSPELPLSQAQQCPSGMPALPQGDRRQRGSSWHSSPGVDGGEQEALQQGIRGVHC